MTQTQTRPASNRWVPGASGNGDKNEPRLCPEQEHLVDLITSGRNVFYTGSAGSGKSTVLKAFTKRLKGLGKVVRIVAPTGKAALQVNGTTTWAFAGWSPNSHKRSLEALMKAVRKPSEMIREHGEEPEREMSAQQRMVKTDVLVIDEISLVENLHLERLNEVMKAARYPPGFPKQRAFGGVQVVVTGDFCQLPPVKPYQHCLHCGRELVETPSTSGIKHVCKVHGEYDNEDKWAFQSAAWRECNFAHVHLKTIHRQKDPVFIRILQQIRTAKIPSDKDLDLLTNHHYNVRNAVKLFPTRKEAALVNQQEFERLRGIAHTYWCLDNFHWQEKLHPELSKKQAREDLGPRSQGPLYALKDHIFEKCVELKEGMPVVLLVNLDLAAGLCNGSQGTVRGFIRENPPVKSSHNLYDKFASFPGVSDRMWPIVKFFNNETRVIYPNSSITELGDDEPYSLLIRTQIPLSPAWAMTIHKSQGMTLDRVIIDLNKAFEPSQVYVGLSRVRELRGLKIEGDLKSLLTMLKQDEIVHEFHSEHFDDLE